MLRTVKDSLGVLRRDKECIEGIRSETLISGV